MPKNKEEQQQQQQQKRQLTQQIPHLPLHILDQLAHIRHVAPVVLDRHVHFHLPRQVPAQVHAAQNVRPGTQMQDDGRCELVVRRAGPVQRLEDVDTVPTCFVLGLGGYGWIARWMTGLVSKDSEVEGRAVLLMARKNSRMCP